MSEINLKPCPFCGEKAEIQKELVRISPKEYYYKVSCASINCNINAYTELYPKVEDVIEAWNRRG